MGNKKYDVNNVREYAESCGGKLISTEYNNPHEKMLFACADCGCEYSVPFYKYGYVRQKY